MFEQNYKDFTIVPADMELETRLSLHIPRCWNDMLGHASLEGGERTKKIERDRERDREREREGRAHLSIFHVQQQQQWANGGERKK